MQTHEQYNGPFLSTDDQFAGHLCISGPESIVKLISKKYWSPKRTEYIDIHGTLSDGKKASLLNCVQHGQTQHHIDNYTQFETTLFPNYIVVGNNFVKSHESVIRAVRFHLENIASLVSGHKTFQSLMPNREAVRTLLDEDYKRSEEVAKQHGWTSQPFEPEIGEHPILLYFSGVWEIVAFDTNIGRISLTNRISHDMGSSAGISLKNNVSINIDFIEPKTLNDCIRAVHYLHSLFELCLGRRDRFRWIELELTHYTKEEEQRWHQTARLYWSMCNNRVENKSKTSPLDALLAPDRRPAEFAKVAAGWMDSSEIMGDPRERFATAFYGKYGINRIVGAANMFDLLPESLAPKKKEPDASLKIAVEQCRRIFDDLPDSASKQSVLSALGRVGRSSLRDKINYRAEKIISATGKKFNEIFIPCNLAVLARNHYVHGSKASFDYNYNLTELIFITDTLEFVFAAADLLDLGWDLKGWMSEGTSMTHPFGAYVVNYPHNMLRLKSLLGK